MEYAQTINRKVLERCHRCQWWYVADDSEFPGRFLIDLAYQVCDGLAVLRAVEPVAVVTTDCHGNPLFSHTFTEGERPQIWGWFHARWQRRFDRLTESMAAEVDQDRLVRSESVAATFLEQATDAAFAN